MKNPKKDQKKGNDVKADDDSIDENTEKTPLAKCVKKTAKKK
jgi:hypothetical protein